MRTRVCVGYPIYVSRSEILGLRYNARQWTYIPDARDGEDDVPTSNAY